MRACAIVALLVMWPRDPGHAGIGRAHAAKKGGARPFSRFGRQMLHAHWRTNGDSMSHVVLSAPVVLLAFSLGLRAIPDAT